MFEFFRDMFVRQRTVENMRERLNRLEPIVFGMASSDVVSTVKIVDTSKSSSVAVIEVTHEELKRRMSKYNKKHSTSKRSPYLFLEVGEFVVVADNVKTKKNTSLTKPYTEAKNVVVGLWSKGIKASIKTEKNSDGTRKIIVMALKKNK